MTSGPIGESFVLVSPDLRGFSAKLKAELDTAFRAVKDPKVKVKVKVEPDFTGFITELRRKARELNGKAQVKVGTDLDRTSLNRALAQIKRAAAASDPKVTVKADTRQATASLGVLQRALRSTGQEQRSFGQTIQLLKFPLLAAGASLAAQAINAAAAAALGLASSLGQLAGLLVALPAFAGAAAQGIVTLLVAFNGIGKALKAYSTLQASAGQETAKAAKTAAAAGETQRRTAESVADAQRSLARVQQQSSQAAVDALRSVREAQEDLTRARRDALEDLKDLRLEERGLALSQEEGALRLKEAQQELNQVLADPASTEIEKQRAALRVRQAKLDRDETVRRIELNRREIREGVEGAGAVVAARERVTDAQRSAARSAKESTQAIADAQRSVTRALRDQATAARSATSATAAGSGAANAFNREMSKLAPAGQRFVRFLISLKPRIDELKQAAQSGLLPGVERGLRRLVDSPLFGIFKQALHDTGLALGSVAEKGAKMLSGKLWRQDFKTIAKQNAGLIRTFGDVGLNLADALRNVLIAAGPLVDWLADLALQWSEQIKGAAETGRQTGKLAGFFERTKAVAEKFIAIIKDLGVGFFNVLKAAAPLGDFILDLFGDLAARFRDFTESTRGKRELAAYFEQAKPAIEETLALVVDVGKALVGFGTGPGFADLVRQIRAEFLPALVTAAKQLSGTFGPAVLSALTSFVRLLGDLGSQGGTLVILAQALGGIADALDFLVREVPGFKELLGVMIAFAAVTRALKFGGAVLGIKDFVGWLLRLTPVARAATVANAGLGASLVNLGAAGVAAFSVFETGRDGLRALKTGTLDARDPVTLLIDKVFGLKLGLTEETKAAMDAAEATKANAAAAVLAAQNTSAFDRVLTSLNDALRAGKRQLDALRDSTLGAFEAETSLRRSKLALKDAQAEVTRLEKAGKKGTDEYKLAVLNLRDAQSGVVRNKASFVGALEEARAKIKESKDVSVAQVESLVKMYKQFGVKPPKDLLDHLKELKDRINGVPNRSVIVTARGVFKAPKGIIAIPGGGGTFSTADQRAKGGPIFGAGTGTSDSIPAWLSHGEHVWTAAEVRKVGGHAVMEAWRRMIRGYASGGPVLRSPIPRFASGGAVEDARPGGLRVTTRGSMTALEEGISSFDRNIDRFALALGKSLGSQLNFGGSGKLSGAKFGGAAMSYIADFIRKAGVAFQIISGFRAGARTRGTGSVSLHALGRALDLVGAGGSSMRDIWAAATKIPFKKEVIFSPAPFQIYGSRKHAGPPSNPRTRADHYNHVHVGLFDRGGFLMPGLTLAENRTGRPERVVPAERDILGRLSYGGGTTIQNLIVQPLSGQFRLRDVLTELALQGVH